MAWQLQEAKQHFSEVVQRARIDGPQIVTRHGREVVVIIDISEYRHLTEHRTDFRDFLLSFPSMDDRAASVFDEIAAERAARPADEVDAVRDVEEAVHVPLAVLAPDERGVPRARHAEAGPGGDAQQVEVGIARRELTLDRVHVGVERLHVLADLARRDVGLAVRVDGDRAVEARERPGPDELQLEVRVERLDLAAQSAARRRGRPLGWDRLGSFLRFGCGGPGCGECPGRPDAI